MSEISKCPKCGGEYVYFDGSLYVCPDCGHEFNEDNSAETSSVDVPKDSNGAELLVIKRGTKVKSIRLTEDPGEVDCKIDGSSIVLKTCFLKKE